MIGKTLGHYEITDKLGQGGMGSVWLAQDSKLGRQVAIKTLPEEFAQDEERLARFEREAKLLASLNHPNIATIHGLEEHEGTRFLVLELVEGDTLADQLKRGAIPVEESLKLALQIAEALEAAHEKGVIHRDLKPANIKVTPEGKVKVLDFGLAKAFAGDGSDVNLSQSPTLSLAATQQGVILGTAAYMSPEQAKGLRADRRADIFSFGCVLFEMLTGRQAFQGSLATEIMASVITREPDYTTLQTDLNPRIKDLLHRCFEKEPKNRWQAVGDVRFETEQVLADPEGLLVEPSPAPLSQSFWPRAIPLVAATVIVTAVIAGIAVWNLRPTDPPEAQPIVRFSHILGSDQVFTRRGRPLVALSPDGTTLAYVANTRLYLRKLAEMESTPIQGAEDDPYNPFFSDDGEWVGYYSGVSDQLKKIPIDGGVAVPLAKVPAPYGASWTAENTILYVESGGVGRVSADGGPTELLVEARNGEQVHGPQLLPGGEWILFTTTTETGPTRWEEAQVVVESLATAERKQLVVGSDGRYLPTGHLVYAVKDALFAVPFDLREIAVTGGPNAVLDGVQRAISPSLTTGTANFVVSQTGVLAYVAAGVSSDRFTLALVDHNGNVEPLDVQPRPYIDPRVSPDGSTLVVCTFEPDGRDALWLYDLAGDSDIQRLTFEGSNWLPVWSPDGGSVAFSSDRHGDWRIYRQEADSGAEAEEITSPEPGQHHFPESWSSENVLSYRLRVGTDAGDIWAVGPDGSSRAIVEADVDQLSSAFSPDGKLVAYVSSESGANEIWVKAFPDGETRQMTREGGHSPVWSPDGERLYYRHNESGSIAVLNVSTGSGVGVSDGGLLPISIIDTPAWNRMYDIMPDGQRFLVVLPAGRTASAQTTPPSINIVLNWFEELKERVPVP